jgi:hypothetical protein
MAQANAHLALMLALGELQKEMGPDQRISAPGGQLLKEGDKSARNHWTGVYESWPAGSEMRPAPVFRRWLLSGNEQPPFPAIFSPISCHLMFFSPFSRHEPPDSEEMACTVPAHPGAGCLGLRGGI